MLWRLLQVYWIVSVLDLRCMAIDDTSPIKLKTKNNGIVDPFSFEVFPTAREDTFRKFSKNAEIFQNEENDPDMDIFFKDMDFFKDDDQFYKSPFDGDNTAMNDYFSKSLEESRNRYKEDVNNIDKMFEAPVKSNIDELLRGETTRIDTTSNNLNNSEETSERNDYQTTRESVNISKIATVTTHVPEINAVTSDNSLNANPNLFSDINRAAGSNVVAELVSVTEGDVKSVVDDVEANDENRKNRQSNIREELVGSQDSKSDSFLESMEVVTEISVQETVNGKIVQRKPSSDELRLIERKILGLPLRNTSEQAIEKISSSTQDYDEVGQNERRMNDLYANEDEENGAQNSNLPNEVIDDLSSFLKVDPNFADDGEDKILIDEEVKDMDVILSDKADEYDDANRNNTSTRNKENSIPADIKSDDESNTGQNIDVNNINDGKKDPENKNSASVGNTEDPRNYRKIFHTEHKNSSNVSDVKIMFSETEGDFLDDDDGEYSLNITEKPQIVEENRIFKESKSSKKNNKKLNEADKYGIKTNNKEYVITEDPSIQNYTDLPETEIEEVDKKLEEYDFSTVTTVLNQDDIFVTEPPQIIEFSTPKNYNEERIPDSDDEIENFTEVLRQTTYYRTLVTENVPSFTIKEEVITQINAEKESSTASSKSEERISLSSQNINNTMHLDKSVTELYEDLEEPIPNIPEDPFISKDSEAMDEIDRTMALIKKILYGSEILEEKDGEKLQKEVDINNKEREETVTIPFDTSTLSIDSTISAEEFTETKNKFNIIDVTTDSELSTVETVINTERFVNPNNAIAIDTVIPSNSMTEPNITTIVKINKSLANLSETSIEIVNTDAPKIISFKETKPHEPSPSEVESMYNSKIEEYESLEDISDVSKENDDGWIIFGTHQNKEHEKTVEKVTGKKEENGLEKVKNDNTSTILSNDKNQKLIGAVDAYAATENGQKIGGIILNNSAKFSVKITKEDDTFYVPSSAYIREYANTVNITWESNEYLNNSIALRIVDENEDFYIIKEIMVNLLTGNEFKKQKKSVVFTPVLDDSISSKHAVVRMKDGTYIYFSNVDFLKKNYEQSEHSEASMRERRLWHIEIAFICLTVIAITGVVFYVVAIKTKRKIILREKNELAQVTHC